MPTSDLRVAANEIAPNRNLVHSQSARPDPVSLVSSNCQAGLCMEIIPGDFWASLRIHCREDGHFPFVLS